MPSAKKKLTKQQERAKKKKELEKRANELWKRICQVRWDDKCEICMSRDRLQVHHYIPKSKSNYLRYDYMNGVILCLSCHFRFHNSHNPDDIRELCDRIRKQRGTYWCHYIDKNKKERVKTNQKWLEGEIAKLEDGK